MMRSPWHRDGSEPEPAPLPQAKEPAAPGTERRMSPSAFLDEINTVADQMREAEQIIGRHVERHAKLVRKNSIITLILAGLLATQGLLYLASIIAQHWR